MQWIKQDDRNRINQTWVSDCGKYTIEYVKNIFMAYYDGAKKQFATLNQAKRKCERHNSKST